MSPVKKMESLIPQEVVEQRIFVIRGLRVMIDRDLAELYEEETKYFISGVTKCDTDDI
mgnify:CR=1 FL=1